MKFLVTGGAGFIGSNIVEELLKRGCSVRVLDNFSTGKRENLKEFEKDIELIEGDIRSYHIVRQAVSGIEVILHQAALPSVPRSIKQIQVYLSRRSWVYQHHPVCQGLPPVFLIHISVYRASIGGREIFKRFSPGFRNPDQVIGSFYCDADGCFLL